MTTHTATTPHTDLETAYWEGRIQAEIACQESGDTKAPEGGWAHWLCVGVGLDGFCEAVGVVDGPQYVDRDGPGFLALTREFARGCREECEEIRNG